MLAPVATCIVLFRNNPDAFLTMSRSVPSHVIIRTNMKHSEPENVIIHPWHNPSSFASRPLIIICNNMTPSENAHLLLHFFQPNTLWSNSCSVWSSSVLSHHRCHFIVFAKRDRVGRGPQSAAHHTSRMHISPWHFALSSHFTTTTC